MISSGGDPLASGGDPTPRVAPARRAWSRWADSVSAAVPDGHISLDAVVALVDEELPPAPARRAAEHVDRCLSCAVEVATQRQARGALRGADAPEVPSSLLSSLQSIPARSTPDHSGPDPLDRDPATGAAPSPPRRRRLRRPGA